jgi:hypothetical protein
VAITEKIQWNRSVSDFFLLLERTRDRNNLDNAQTNGQLAAVLDSQQGGTTRQGASRSSSSSPCVFLLPAISAAGVDWSQL